jgi:hypothetical protein
MNSNHQQDLESLAESQGNVIESQGEIIDELREILAREAPDREIVRTARLALSAWYANVHPHLHPDRDRPQLRVIQGGGEGTGRLF